MTSTATPAASLDSDDQLDFADLFRRIFRGLPATIGFALIGASLTCAIFFATIPIKSTVTTSRVSFNFAGFEKGTYPDGSKFSPDDLRAPEIVAEALRRKEAGITQDASLIRSALTIEAVIPESVIKERDKQRALGQTPRNYISDEYIVTLTLPRSFPLTNRQKELLLQEIISVYQERFTRTYVALPLEVGKAFQSLEGADYFDYDMVLNREGQNLVNFLNQMSESARGFRSPRTNLSFSELLKQSQLFTQLRLNEVLGLIRRDGLSRDRNLALVKMDYYLKTLGDEELKAVQEEKVVHDLLKQAQEREQRLALGVKSQTTQQRSDGFVVDQGLVDSLLANDAYNFLVRQALEASLKTRRIQSELAILQERRTNMETFIKSNAVEKSEALTQFQRSLDELRKVYDELITNVRLTYEDYNKQSYSDAVRVSMQAKTDSFYRSLIIFGISGLVIGTAFGLGLSLLGVGFGRRPAS